MNLSLAVEGPRPSRNGDLKGVKVRDWNACIWVWKRSSPGMVEMKKLRRRGETQNSNFERIKSLLVFLSSIYNSCRHRTYDVSETRSPLIVDYVFKIEIGKSRKSRKKFRSEDRESGSLISFRNIEAPLVPCSHFLDLLVPTHFTISFSS